MAQHIPTPVPHMPGTYSINEMRKAMEMDKRADRILTIDHLTYLPPTPVMSHAPFKLNVLRYPSQAEKDAFKAFITDVKDIRPESYEV